MVDLGDFCQDVFATLGRTDQRRAAQTYLYGLLNCIGRKSIRRLAAVAADRSEQSLQQFINQSPWDAEPVRRRLMTHLVQAFPPVAWAVEELAFPKNGQYSAAVDRQYVRALGRVCNCQLAVSVVFVSEQLSVPVNWRLVVPEPWGRDKERRARAKVPDHELPRPYWQYHLEILDHMALEWGMPPVPVLADTRQRAGMEAFLRALELRRQEYVARVGPSMVVGFGRPQNRPSRNGERLSGGASEDWWGPAGDLVIRTAQLARETVEWCQGDRGSVQRSQFLRIPVKLMPDEAATQPRRVLIAEWPLSKALPLGFWITNMVDTPLSELVAQAKRQERVGPAIADFAGHFGLRDYEGRTFAGWHHHVTLATAAGIFKALNQTTRCDGTPAETGSPVDRTATGQAPPALTPVDRLALLPDRRPDPASPR